ncbi:MAG: hypothetical protein AABW88_05130, partial [Nanoarchaeota archaeon]
MKKLLLITIGILLIESVLAFNAIQNITVIILPGIIDVFSPVQDAVYNNRMVLINLSMSANVSYFKYADNGGSLRTLCRKCDSYSKKKPFDDGFHELTIFGIFNIGTVYNYVNFMVDSKKPRILKTNPRRGFATGFFEVEFEEENPVSLFLNYGNELRNAELNISECEKKKTKRICNVSVELADYDLQEIEYWFNITDIAGNSDESKNISIDVDVSAPIISFFNYSINGEYVTFLLNITEPNFEEVDYIDWSDLN